MRYRLLPALTLLAVACGAPRPWSPLAEAVGRNDVTAMKALLETTPLSADDPHELMMWAARNGAGDAIALLASRGVDVNERDAGRNHWTPLQHAVHTQQPGAVRVLLEWGADPDATQPGTITPLFMAADSPDPTMVQLLLDAGADVHFTGPGGRTPLTQAVSGGALWDVTDRPLLGGCRTATVRALVTGDPALRLAQRTKAWNAAVWWARIHDCTEVLSLVGAWPTRTAADKIVTTGGMIKDVLGVQTPKDVLRGTPATDVPSRR
jgi:ankyrin repeat protein